MVHAFLHHGGPVRRSLFEDAEHRRHVHEFPLEKVRDLVAFGHDVVEKHAVFPGGMECPLEERKALPVDAHRLVREHVYPGLCARPDGFGFAAVVSGQHHDVSWFLDEETLQKIRARVNPYVPVCGTFDAVIVSPHAPQEIVEVGSLRRVHIHGRRHGPRHRLQHQGGVEMPGIENHEMDSGLFRFIARSGFRSPSRRRGGGGSPAVS